MKYPTASSFLHVTISVASVLFLTSVANATRFYVDAAAAGENDGTSWEDAYLYLQDALEDAAGSEGPHEIWVAQGTYYPLDGLDSPPGDDKDASFALQVEVGIFGGFAATESALSQRNPEKNITILSGDIGDLGEDDDNSYHVVTAISVSDAAELNGFTITKGIAPNTTRGSGMFVVEANPLVVHCTFLQNGDDSAGYGGGMSIEDAPTHSTMHIVNCSFFGNRTGGHAGAFIVLGTTTEFTVELDNCVFSGNVANTHGGVFCSNGDSSVALRNCTLVGNDGVGTGGGFAALAPTVLRNCIVWDNEPNQVFDSSTFASFYYSDIEGGWGGTGSNNINQDPDFCDADGSDDEVGTADDNLRLQDVSPCIDEANDGDVPNDFGDVDDDSITTGETLPWDRDNEKPLSQWGRFFDVASGPGSSNVDMGAFENQHIADCPPDIASSGYTAPPDGDVGTPDYLMMLADWGSCPGCGADLDCDLVVGSADYLILLGAWGECGEGFGEGGTSELDEALLGMGFSDLEDYQEWIAEASAEEIYAAALELGEILSD
jgi:hypothetical protein